MESFILNYTVTNAITLHPDTAEFYWQLVGDEWEISQNKIRVTIKPPPGTDPDTLQAWAHGPTAGMVSIDNEGIISYDLNYLPIGEFFEARITLPKALFTAGASGTNTQEKIISQENEWIRETIRKIVTR